MAFPLGPRDPSNVPLHVLFPEEYENSKKMIARDFLLIGCFIVGAVVGTAFFFTQ